MNIAKEAKAMGKYLSKTIVCKRLPQEVRDANEYTRERMFRVNKSRVK